GSVPEFGQGPHATTSVRRTGGTCSSVREQTTAPHEWQDTSSRPNLSRRVRNGRAPTSRAASGMDRRQPLAPDPEFTYARGRASWPIIAIYERTQREARMRWRNERQSTNVEDRRGMGGGRIALGGGGLIIVLLLSWLFGVDPRALLQQLPSETSV